jgi:hypothetical protein
MSQATDIYNELLKQGINPMRRLVGPEYEVLIPLSGLERFEYDPSYGKDYRNLGIYKETFGLNPQAYTVAFILNKLGRDLGIKFRVNDAWRPIEIQIEKYILNKIKKPDSTLFANPFGEGFDWVVEDEDFGLDFNADGRKSRFWAKNADEARALAVELANDSELSKFLRPTPHSVGGAMDIMLLDGRGNPMTQPKWLARKIWQDLQFANWDFGKINDPFILSFRTELESAKESEKDTVLLIEKKLLEKIKPMRHEQLLKAKPMYTTHMQATIDAPDYLKNTIVNVDYLMQLAGSMLNFTITNDENWHVQCTNIREFALLTIDKVMRTSKGHIDAIKKECEDFANQIFPLGYKREVRRGEELILFKGAHFQNPAELSEEEFARSDLNFDKNNLMTLSQLQSRLMGIAARQRGAW